MSSARVRTAYDQIAPWLMSIWNKNEEVPVLEQVRRIVGLLDEKQLDFESLPRLALEEAYAGPIEHDPFRIDTNTIPLLKELKRQGYKLGLISNTGRTSAETQRQRMKDAGIYQYFDATVFSNEVGWRKPDPRIFSALVNSLHVDPIRTIHVGDNPHADIGGAKQVGMKALLFKYVVPEGFRKNSNSLLALSRKSDEAEEVHPDGTINTLSEILNFLK